MTEFTLKPGVGVADLQRAALMEARRFMKAANGDRAVANLLVLDRLLELGHISEAERDVLRDMHQVSNASHPKEEGDLLRGRRDDTATYLRLRRMYDDLLAKGGTGEVALVLASSLVGSFEMVATDDGQTVIHAKSNRSYQGVLGGAGAIIGGALGGPTGAAIGGAIGGVIGTIVDDCRD